MRKLISILLLATFALPFLSALPALAETPESRLPACCKRVGAHHCTMSVEELAQLAHGQHFTTAHSKCPLFPKAIALAHCQTPALHLRHDPFAAAQWVPVRFRQIEVWARIALQGTRHKRGPPAVRLS